MKIIALLALLLAYHPTHPQPTPPTTLLTLVSPDPSHPIPLPSPPNPLSLPLDISVDINQHEMETFAASLSPPLSSLLFKMELSSLDSPPNNPQFDPASTALFQLSSYQENFEAVASRLIPGRRAIRLSIVTDPPSHTLASHTYVFTIVDPSASAGAEIDVSTHTSASAPPSYSDYFSQVYRYKVWSAGGSLGPDSGPGSQLSMTMNVRSKIAECVLCAREASAKKS